MRILTRKQAKEAINRDIPITNYLSKAPHGGYICPYCGSGKGPHGTGAVKVYRDTNTAACHACHDPGKTARKFDVLDCIQKSLNCDYNMALQEGARILGFEIASNRGAAARVSYTPEPPETTQSAQDKTDDKTHAGQPETPQEGTETAAEADYSDYYMECMQRLDDPAALSYLQARGISIETAQTYDVGFDPESDPANMPGAPEGVYRPYPVPRLIIPCSNGFYIARSIDPKTPTAVKAPNPKDSKPKYFNGKEIRRPGPLFVAEGAIDALSIIEVGGRAMALNSTNQAGNFIKSVKRHKDAIQCDFIICMDNDKAGREAEEIIDKGLQEAGVKYIIANISGSYNDPNEALIANRAAFVKAIQEAQAEVAAAMVPDYLTDFFKDISSEKYKPYKTGLQWFDYLLSGGPIRQTVLLLLAAPAAGKTTLCQQIGECMAMNGKPVLYINLEMSQEQMIAKSLSGHATANGEPMTAADVLQGYKWTESQRQAVTEALEHYRENIRPYMRYNLENVGGNLTAIQKMLKEVGDEAKAAGKEAPVVVLDYLHLVAVDGARGDIQETIKQSVLMLKEYATNYDTFCIAISATNRESNKDGRITRDSGRDSSNIEYTGDYILSLNYYQLDNGTVKTKELDKIAVLEGRAWRQMIVRVLKNRFSVSGRSARVYFHAAGNRFYPEYDQFIPADVVAFDETDTELDNAGIITATADGDVSSILLDEVPKKFRGRRR